MPGGRIRKGEHFDAAFSRLVREELGVELTLAQARFLGPYEHHYSDNVFGEQFSTLYVVLGFEVILPEQPDALPCAQHGEYQGEVSNGVLFGINLTKRPKICSKRQPALSRYKWLQARHDSRLRMDKSMIS